eukprot:CAMPEP_0176034988 /NCGR_PEP_ID=MMETSP0120_2-20121206/17300_1 /TAXON_ID=160619 /ORGANISM="Kryptoperidinium foliaceum, Strain CCMP 1326" /LENGTH=144 /DNA_ID=CAMNT_0017368333 /DNA_START=84 /DNA_END=518 /DNA_ORIENTATION=+
MSAPVSSRKGSAPMMLALLNSAVNSISALPSSSFFARWPSLCCCPGVAVESRASPERLLAVAKRGNAALAGGCEGGLRTPGCTMGIAGQLGAVGRCASAVGRSASTPVVSTSSTPSFAGCAAAPRVDGVAAPPKDSSKKPLDQA